MADEQTTTLRRGGDPEPIPLGRATLYLDDLEEIEGLVRSTGDSMSWSMPGYSARNVADFAELGRGPWPGLRLLATPDSGPDPGGLEVNFGSRAISGTLWRWDDRARLGTLELIRAIIRRHQTWGGLGNTRVYFVRRSDAPGFWERNRDRLLVDGLLAILGAIVGFILGRLS